MKAGEPVHIQLNEETGHLEAINNHPDPISGAKAHLWIYNLDGSIVYERDFAVSGGGSSVIDLDAVEWPATLSTVHFIRAEMRDASGVLLSNNFYWRALPEQQDNLQDLNKLATVTLDATITRRDADGRCLLQVTLHNPEKQVALMVHLQLRRKDSNDRVLPVYYSDQLRLPHCANGARVIAIEAAQSDLKKEMPLVLLDGWNVSVKPVQNANAAVGANLDANVEHWPSNGLAFEGVTGK